MTSDADNSTEEGPFSPQKVAEITGDVMGDMVHDNPEKFPVELRTTNWLGGLVMGAADKIESVSRPATEIVNKTVSKLVLTATGVGLRLLRKKDS